MRFLILGDIYGRSGRDAIKLHVPSIQKKYNIDITIANIDNLAHGRGATTSALKELSSVKIDLFTGGDHIWDNREILTHLDREPYILRPINLPDTLPGKGYRILNYHNKRILVIHALGRVYMPTQSDNPFLLINQLVEKYTLGTSVDAILVDFHAEATSEKNAMGFYLDGKVSAVIGTHTHIPTADCRILPKKSAYCTDIGMCGDYHSIIGADLTTPIGKFTSGVAFERMKPAEGEGTISGVVIETDDQTGLAKTIELIQAGKSF